MRRCIRWAAAMSVLLGCAGGSPTVTTSDAADVALLDAVSGDVATDVTPTDVTPTDVTPTAPDVATADVPTAAGDYPEGPYGNRAGDVLANLEWEGYVNATGEEVSTSLAFAPTSLQDLRGDGRGYALIHLAEFL